MVGFGIVFVLAVPAVMRKNFAAADRIGIDRVRSDTRQIERLLNPEKAKRLEQRHNRRQAVWYIIGGAMFAIAFAPQVVALFVQ